MATPAHSRPSSDMAKFREIYKKSKHVVVLTGAGVSAESGIATFRGTGGLWRTWKAQDLASPSAFARNPSLVWEFHHYRREVMSTKHPNPAHIAIAEAEKHLRAKGRRLVLVTQNIDELHTKAGSKEVVELHGCVLRTECTKCGEVLPNTDSPICPSLAGKGAPDPSAVDARIPESELPRCQKCSGLLRPNVVWFGENPEPDVLRRVDKELDMCDLCLVVGTSSVVFPAALFGPQVAARGVPVAELNVETTPVTPNFEFYFEGPCASTLPEALAA